MGFLRFLTAHARALAERFNLTWFAFRLGQLLTKVLRTISGRFAKARFSLAGQAASSCDQPLKNLRRFMGKGTLLRQSRFIQSSFDATDWRAEWPGLTTLLVNALQRAAVIILAA